MTNAEERAVRDFIEHRLQAADWWLQRFLLVAISPLCLGIVLAFVALGGSGQFTAWLGLTLTLATIVATVVTVMRRFAPQNNAGRARNRRTPNISPLVALTIFFSTPLGKKVMRGLAAAIAMEFAISLGLSVIPIQNDRGLLVFLLLSLGAATFFAIAEKHGASKLFGLVAAGLTLVLFLGGRAEAAGNVKQLFTSASPAPVPTETFSVGKGEEVTTFYGADGAHHVICANHPWVVLSQNAGDTAHTRWERSAGCTDWYTHSPSGRLRVRGLENGTTLQVQQVK